MVLDTRADHGVGGPGHRKQLLELVEDDEGRPTGALVEPYGEVESIRQSVRGHIEVRGG